MKTSRLYNILMLLCLLFAPCLAQAQDKVITQEDLGGRKALVGKGCVVNQFATNVQLLSGISGLENLVDEDLDNFATFTTGVAVGLTEQPLFSVKDINHTYAAGTEAGICMVSSQSGGLLSLSVIQLFSILVYNDGELVETISDLESGQAGSGVGLDLIKIPGSDNMAVNLTCTPKHDFDELYVVQSGGLDVSVIKELKFKYAFVGAPRQCVMTDKGIKEYGGSDAEVKANASCTVALIPTPTVDADNLVDDDLTNATSIVSVLSIGYKGAAKLSTDPDEPYCGVKNRNPEPTVTFPAGSEVGFVYTNGSALDLALGNYIEIKVYNTDGTTQTERIEAGVLSLGVAEGGKMTSSVVADKEFYAVEIGFYAAVNVNLGTINVHYAYVNEPPMVNHHCPINPSVSSEICDVQGTYQLLSNPSLSVRWELVSASDLSGNDWTGNEDWTGNSVTVTPSGKVVFNDIVKMVPVLDEKGESVINEETGEPDSIDVGTKFYGTFTFRATSVGCTHSNKCIADVILTRGIQTYNAACAMPIYNKDVEHPEYELTEDTHGASGALISISELKNNENILDDDFNNCATYRGGLSIASNIHIVAVKNKNGDYFEVENGDGTQAETKRIGFVVESKSTFLNADVLQFFQIRCYKNGEEVYRQLVDESNAISVGLIEGDQSQKVRFSIEVPAVDEDGDKIEFDEFALWTAGVLKLDISTLNIYYPFIEDGGLDCSDPLNCAEVITADDGATAYPDMKFQTASIAGVVQNLGNLIDDDPDTYFLYQNTVQAGSGMVVTVKLGKTLDYRHQFGIIMDSETFLASVGLGTWMTVETYYNGQPTGDKFDNWGVLGLDLIGYGDKSYLVNQPTRNFDEVRITFAGIANVLNGYKLYGLFFRGDKNLNGIVDCMDPDQSCAEDLGLSVSKVCVYEEMELEGQVQGVDNEFRIIVKAPDQKMEETDDESDVEGTDEPGKEETDESDDVTWVPFESKAIKVGSGKFKIKIPTTTSGTGFNIKVYEARESGKAEDGTPIYEAGRYLDGVTYAVHPTRAEWRKTPISTDWNEPNNWDGNVSPYCCTDVVIPDGAERYPVLPTLEPTKDEDGNEIPVDPATYCCNGIYFKASPDGDADNPAQVVNVPELAYAKAWVDVRMMPNRYYMFSAPLKNTHTGDLFVPAEMNGQQTGMEFTDLNETNTAQNRFSPRMFQRMYKKTPRVRLLDKLYYNNTTEMRKDDYGDAELEKVTEGFIADWSKPFNLLAQTYTNNEGFTVWVDNGDLPADSAVVMRLPKQHLSYNYYTPDGVMLPEHEEKYPGAVGNDDLHNYDEYTDAATSLKRTNNVRFIYEKYEEDNYDKLAFAEPEKAVPSKYVENGYEEAYADSISAKYQAKKADSPFDDEGSRTERVEFESGSDKFVVGNMFMSDIDIQTFLAENTTVKALRRYNGDNYETYALVDGVLKATVPGEVVKVDKTGEPVTDGDGNEVTGPGTLDVVRKPVIHPLESFFVDFGGSGEYAEIKFTRDMMLKTVPEGEDEGQQPNAVPMLRVTAEAGGRRAAVLVADSAACVDVETMLDAEVKPTVAVFAATGGKAHDIVSTHAAEIPLGVVMAEADTLTLSFRAEGGIDPADWELVDRADGTAYGLDAPVTFTGAGSSVGRFVLRSRSRMAEEMAAGGNRVYVACRGGEAVATASAGFCIERMDVYTVDGVMCGSAESADGATCAVKVPRGSVVVIRVTGSGGDAETFKMLTP